MTLHQTELLSAPAFPPIEGIRAPRLAYQVGGVSFGLNAPDDVPLILDPGLKDFAVEADTCDVTIEVAWTESLEIPQDTPLFHSGGLWSLFREPRGYRFSFSTAFLGETPYKAAWVDREFTRVQVLLSRRYFATSRPVYPLEYPLDELLMIHRLSRGQGVEMHAVGIADETRRGHLFLGHSGAGKSTTARLWKSRPGVRILSDDRIILRIQDGQVWMFGTPWHGDAGIASPDRSPLHHIYFLEHASRNERVLLPPGQATAELFARAFVPRHCAEGLQFALSFLGCVARQIPCSIFRFVPEESAVEAIRCAGD